MSKSFTINRQARWLPLVLLAFMVTNLFAVPPAAPTEMVHQVTRAGFEGLNVSSGAIVSTGKYICHLLRWKDNAQDEEGYDVGMRFGNFGSYTPVARLGANETEIVVPTRGDGDLKPGVPVQFQIIAWKYNGIAMESTTVSFNSTIPPFESKPGFLITSPSTPLAATDRVGEPTNLTVTAVNDGTYRLNWQDNCSSEIYYEIQYGEQLPPAVTGDPDPPVAYRRIGFVNFNTTAFTLSNQIFIPETNSSSSRLTLVPGKSYRFSVRATRRAPSGITPLFNESNVVTATEAQIATKRAESELVTIQSMPAPTNLTATPGEQRLILSWKDNAHNETGYRIERQVPGSTPAAYETVIPEGGTAEKPNLAENSTAAAITINKQLFNEVYRVVALFTYRPQGQTTDTTLTSPSTSTVSVNGPFAAPVNLTATTSRIGRGVDLRWEDKTASEFGFDVLTRPSNSPPGTPFHFARAVRSNVTQVTVTSRTESTDSSTLRPIFIPLEAGVTHEFVVRAVGDSEAVYSANSNIATAEAKNGFIGNLFPPITKDIAFTYQVATSDNAAKTAWNISGLPSGLTFNPTNGLITGSPTTSGLFECPMTAEFGPNAQAQATLTLRILPNPIGTNVAQDLKAPTVTMPISNLTVGINAPFTLPLAGKFTDSDSEAGVRLSTTKGDINIILYPSLAPRGVANFRAYVNGGDYKNMVFHRHSANFVLQGGAVKTNNLVTEIQEITARPPLVNEPGISNVRWTVAAAKLGQRSSQTAVIIPPATTSTLIDRDDSFGYLGNPDSATTDFFINLNDNSSNLDAQNGGFTAYGRVGLSSRSVVNAITALPIGQFGGLFNQVPVDATTLPSNLSANLTVRVNQATEVPVLSFSVDNVSPNIASVTPMGNDLRIVGLAEGTRSVTLTAHDLDGQTATQAFTITVKRGHLAPAIIRHPLSIAVANGATASFSVTATGSPAQGAATLSYQWRRNGTAILAGTPNVTGQGSATLRLTNVQSGNIGSYDVVVGNASGTVTSNSARLDLRAPAMISGTLPPRLVDVGQPIEFEALATGFPTPVFTWRRGTSVIAGQTTNKLRITSAKLSDAGVYQGTANNGLGAIATTTSANVCIIQKGNALQVVKPGVQVKLTVPAAGPFIAFRWRKDGVAIPNGTSGYSGWDQPTLVVTNARLGTGSTGDSADYSCEVTAPNALGTAITGYIRLAVTNKPVLTPMIGDQAPGFGAIGAEYAFEIPYEKSAANTPTRFYAANLPPGLLLEPNLGIIYGRPTKAGKFNFSVFAENPAGNSKPATVGSITILPMGIWTVGTFIAAVEPSPVLNANKGGRLDLTVSDTSAFSARLQMGGEVLTSAGSLNLSGSVSLTNGSNADVYQSIVAFPRKGKDPVYARIQVISSLGDVTGVITDGLGNDTTFSGYRQIWHPVRRPGPFASTVTYNASLGPRPQDQTNNNVPQGIGYMQMTVGSSGTTNIVGRLGDGSSFTTASVVSRNQLIQIYHAYNSGRAAIRASVALYPHTVTSGGSTKIEVPLFGTARWIEDSQVTPFDRSYGSGIPATTLDIRGGIYSVATAPQTVLGTLRTVVSNSTGDARFNALLDFSEGGLAAASRNPDLKFEMRPISTLVLPPSAENITATKVTIVPGSGLFSGSFALLDRTTLKRASNFAGLIIPAISSYTTKDSNNQDLTFVASPIMGTGHFLLDQLPPPPSNDLRTTPTLSGKVSLQAIPVFITQHPVSRTVNPGATVTFDVQTSESGVVTFQWRKNGVNLSEGAPFSGVKSSTLTITDVQEANEGSYDCVLDNTFTFTSSNPATLSVNDPVTNIVVSRSPSTSSVAVHTQVTFSVTSGGSVPLNYQWMKNGEVIAGAINATYVIGSADFSDSGSYKVKVSNGVTTTGLESSPVVLTVEQPISNVVAIRTPATENVALSSQVTFSVTTQGSTPSYQWKLGGNNIAGANSDTYVIDTVSKNDEGNYTVDVSNNVSGPVTSNVVPLVVFEGISNIVVTKSFAARAVEPNTIVTFNVSAVGAPPITYQWRKNGVEIGGETNTSLTITAPSNITEGTPDKYDVLLFNPLSASGVASEEISLHVANPVTMAVATRDPATEDIIALTQQVVFNVTADGSAPLFYRWRKNGIPIEGATGKTYTLPLANLGDSGSYDCVVSNLLNIENQGTATNEVILNVVP